MNKHTIVSLLTPFIFLLLLSCDDTSTASYAPGTFPDSSDIPAKHQEQLKLAHNGNSNAQLLIAHTYIDGDGVAVDNDKAISWMTLAAEAGHTKSQRDLGSLYLSSKKDRQQSFKWFKKAAENGEITSMFETGLFYQSGEGTKLDRLKAYQWIKLSLIAAEKTGKLDAVYDYRTIVFSNLKSTLKKKQIKQGDKWVKQKIKALKSKSIT